LRHGKPLKPQERKQAISEYIKLNVELGFEILKALDTGGARKDSTISTNSIHIINSYIG